MENQAEGRVTIGKVTVAHGKALRKYSSSSPASYPKGSVWVAESDHDGMLSVHYSLSDLSPSQEGGMHVHAGTTCENSGGHFYTPNGNGDPDPWNVVKYSADEFGNAAGSFEIQCGYDLKDIIGRTFVVHNGNGQRVACTELVENNEALAFQYDMTGVLESESMNITIMDGVSCGSVSDPAT